MRRTRWKANRTMRIFTLPSVLNGKLKFPKLFISSLYWLNTQHLLCSRWSNLKRIFIQSLRQSRYSRLWCTSYLPGNLFESAVTSGKMVEIAQISVPWYKNRILIVNCSKMEMAAFTTVFSNPEICLCSWHMLRAFHMQASSKLHVS